MERATRATKRTLDESHEQERARLTSEARARLAHLHPREIEALQYIAMGVYDKQAAHYMGISVVTFRCYRGEISRKTQARGRVNLARLAFRAGVASIWSTTP